MNIVIPEKTKELLKDISDSAMYRGWNQSVSATKWNELLGDNRFGKEVEYILARMFMQYPYSVSNCEGTFCLAGTTWPRDVLRPDNLEYHLRYRRMAKEVHAGQHEKTKPTWLAPAIVVINDLLEKEMGRFFVSDSVYMRQIWKISPNKGGVEMLNLRPVIICDGLATQTSCYSIQRKDMKKLGWETGKQPSTLVVVSIVLRLKKKRTSPIDFSLIIIKPPKVIRDDFYTNIFG